MSPAEMERRGFDIPLLIGGATTSRVHTAVKIHPRYEQRPDGLCHRRQPRRRRGLGAALAGDSSRYVADDPGRIREGRRGPRPDARPKSSACRWPRPARTPSRPTGRAYEPPKPTFLGTKVFESYDLADLARYIDWTPFFQAWEMKGRYPADPRRRQAGAGGAAALGRRAGDAGQDPGGSWFRPKAVIGFWPANALATTSPLHRRERRDRAGDLLHACASSCPSRRTAEPGAGRFRRAGRAAAGLHRRLRGHRRPRGTAQSPNASSAPTTTIPPSSSRPSPTASPRPSPSAARAVRKEFWGYAPDEAITPDELLQEKYRGIRPAPGYPAQPDHTEKTTLFRLLNAKARIGVDSPRATPCGPARRSPASLSHPDAYYFGVAKVERDQVEDYARRKGMAVAEVERWLGRSSTTRRHPGRRLTARLDLRPAGRLCCQQRGDLSRPACGPRKTIR